MDKTAMMLALASGNPAAIMEAVEPDDRWEIGIETDRGLTLVGVMIRFGATHIVWAVDDPSIKLGCHETPAEARECVEDRLAQLTALSPHITVTDGRTATVVHQGIPGVMVLDGEAPTFANRAPSDVVPAPDGWRWV